MLPFNNNWVTPAQHFICTLQQNLNRLGLVKGIQKSAGAKSHWTLYRPEKTTSKKLTPLI